MSNSEKERASSAAKSLHDFLDYAEWIGRIPSAKSSIQYERKQAYWLIHLKQARCGKGTCRWFPELDEIAEARGFPGLFYTDTRAMKVFRLRGEVVGDGFKVVKKCKENAPNGQTQWLCRDEYGREIRRTTYEIVRKTNEPDHPSNWVDMTGQKFGRWTVLGLWWKRVPGNEVAWFCQCDCGVVRKIRGAQLRNGRSTSCGCYHRELLSERHQIETPTKATAEVATA